MTNWAEYTPTCDGQNPLITHCLVPMGVLEAAPYLYAQGDVIYVRARAFNSYGPGAFSVVNSTGVKLRTIPH